jgi:hypothetical protein
VSSAGKVLIETGIEMTVRENVHHLVDSLPEGSLEDVLDYLESLGEVDEPLSAGTLAAIEEGRADFRNGRAIVEARRA